MPDVVTDSEACVALGEEMFAAWQADGMLQVATSPELDATTRAAYEESKRFFASR